MCESYSSAVRCNREDVILPTSLIAFLKVELGLREVIQEVAERNFDDVFDYCKWLTERRRVLGQNGSNAFAVFVAIVNQRMCI